MSSAAALPRRAVRELTLLTWWVASSSESWDFKVGASSERPGQKGQTGHLWPTLTSRLLTLSGAVRVASAATIVMLWPSKARVRYVRDPALITRSR